MAEPSRKTMRTRILLQGGGRLEDVDEIVRVALDPGEISCHRLSADQMEVSGEVNAYIYFKSPTGDDVQGEGVKIPFSRQIDVSGMIAGTITPVMDDIRSDYEYDPETGDFQHRITLMLQFNVTEPPGEGHQGETRLSQIRVGPPLSDREPDDETGPAAPEQQQPAPTVPPAEKPDETPAEEEAVTSPPVKPPTTEKEPPDEQPAEKDVLVWKPFPPPIQ